MFPIVCPFATARGVRTIARIRPIRHRHPATTTIHETLRDPEDVQKVTSPTLGNVFKRVFGTICLVHCGR